MDRGQNHLIADPGSPQTAGRRHDQLVGDTDLGLFQGEAQWRRGAFFSRGQKLEIHAVIGQQAQLTVPRVFQSQWSLGPKHGFQQQGLVAHGRAQRFGRTLPVTARPEDGRQLGPVLLEGGLAGPRTDLPAQLQDLLGRTGQAGDGCVQALFQPGSIAFLIGTGQKRGGMQQHRHAGLQRQQLAGK